MKLTTILGIIFCFFALSLFQVQAGDYTKSTTINNYNSYPTTDVINKVISNQDICGPAAVAGASGQHNYKAGTAWQWSFAGVHLTSDTCDASAISGGLAKQFGTVFGTINFNTDLSGSSMIGFGFSGAF